MAVLKFKQHCRNSYFYDKNVGDCPYMSSAGRRGLGFFWCKNSGFYRSLWCSARTGGGQWGRFADNGGGVNFSRFYANVFYGRPSYCKIFHSDKVENCSS